MRTVDTDVFTVLFGDSASFSADGTPCALKGARTV